MSSRAPASTVDATSPARVVAESRAAHDADASGEAEVEIALEAGERAGDFIIEGLLGRGSFGTVYRAAHGLIGRRAAVKVLRGSAATEHAITRFIDEARLVARLRHPNIVDVLTFGRLDDGRHFQVMDLIDGPTLADFLRDRGALALRDAVPILRGIASALDAVHRAGVVHSDLKPANVVVETREGELVPKLIDFGVARLIAPGSEHASPGSGGGTPRYMSPEQCRGNTFDARADTYAFGLLAYEMLTGKPPFAGDDAIDLMLKHTTEAPTAPSAARHSLPPDVDSIVLGLLDKRPEKRPLELAPVVGALEAIVLREATSNGSRGRGWAPVGLAVVGLAAVTTAVVVFRNTDTSTDTKATTSVSPGTGQASETPAMKPPSPTSDRTEPTSAAAATATAAPQHSPSASTSPTPATKPTGAVSTRPRSSPGPEDPENPFGKR